MKNAIFVLIGLILMAFLFVRYPVLMYVSYLGSFIITIILCRYTDDLDISAKQAGMYFGFTILLMIVIGKFILASWLSPFFFYIHFKQHENLATAIAWILLIGIGGANIIMSKKLSDVLENSE